MEYLGWSATALVLIGFYLNSVSKFKWAAIFWIIGDIGWIIYDFTINNFSHALLSTVIIIMNVNLLINQKVIDLNRFKFWTKPKPNNIISSKEWVQDVINILSEKYPGKIFRYSYDDYLKQYTLSTPAEIYNLPEFLIDDENIICKNFFSLFPYEMIFFEPVK